MPVTGRKPKPSGQIRHRVKPVHDWQEVPNVPYAGPVPALPSRARAWTAGTKRWWAVVSRMPHCVLWSEADWQFALDSLAVYEDFADSPAKNSKALMDREKVLGTTLDFRRDLRIRYVDPELDDAGEEASVTVLADYQAAIGAE